MDESTAWLWVAAMASTVALAKTHSSPGLIFAVVIDVLYSEFPISVISRHCGISTPQPPGVFIDASAEVFAFCGAQTVASSERARVWMLFLENHMCMLESVSLSEIPL